ncbi:MAG: pantoate--beta-alanine ligase [Actinomycetota bacterium]
METVRSATKLRELLRPEQAAGRVIGLVPTMGALHEGHLSLVRLARERSDVVVVSIFVNPLQFGAGEDFESYPRDDARDLALANAEKVDVVFVPEVSEMYPEGDATRVSAGALGEVLEGEARPGHFDGVCTVVAKLFNLVAPDIAFFGQKDAQQIAVIKRMVADLRWPIEIVAGAIVREPDGLAMSSRNAYLSRQERKKATVLYAALRTGREAVESGEGIENAEAKMMETIRAVEGVEAGYARAVDPDDFGAPRPGRPILLAVSARVGPARLIDNLMVEDNMVVDDEGVR